MELLDLTILVLRLALVALLYLFLLVVIRAARGWLATTPDEPPVAATRHANHPRREPRRPPSVLPLVVTSPGATDLVPGTTLRLEHDAVLGRGQQATLVLADSTISGRHARVLQRRTGWIVQDLGSTNGTYVNDARVVGEAPLAPGDLLRLGSVEFEVTADYV